MTVLNESRAQLVDIYTEPRSLQWKIKEALCELLSLGVKDVQIQDNKDKYYDPANPFVAGDALEEVFDLMKGLNELALADTAICAGGLKGRSFRDTLERSVADICRYFAGRVFDYVELGPEPAKTGFIVARLQALGARIGNYVCVDINPASNAVMRASLSSLLDPARIHHRITSFERFSLDEIRDRDRPVLVTTLGFQEGNEDPETLPGFYRRLLSPGDLLLSEMQLRPRDGWEPVAAFYGHPFMRRFSRLAFERLFGEAASQTGFAIVPVGTFGDEELAAAVLYERTAERPGRLPKAFVTNYCLKYTSSQYRRLRELSGCLAVASQRLTGDRSVTFQLTRRC